MFKLPRALLEKFLSAIDPWHGSQGHYVAEYRQTLDRAAAEIGQGLRTRFNPSLGCAELVRGRVVLARIKVQGSEGTATESVIERFTVLQPRTREILMKALPNVRFGHLPTD